MNGIEFVEYATTQPQALGAVLQMHGFMPVARHRSREVMLYRQGGMNVIVNAHPDVLPGMSAPNATPALSAMAFRVRDADFAYHRALDLGAWEMPTRASAMELNIPGIHGVGDSLIYFVDRYRDFSIYDVDFVYLPGVRAPSAGARGIAFLRRGANDRRRPHRRLDRLLHADPRLLGAARRAVFRHLPKGTLLESPCHKFYLQMLEPPPSAEDVDWEERLVRLGLGAPDVRAAVKVLKERGVVFVDRDPVQPSDKGALTQIYLGGVTFELVVSHLNEKAEAAR
jgi:4-hydroxyphenylpyruvate dioxygenase